MACFANITGKLTPARIQGTVLSILFALASSMAPADQGFVKMADSLGCAGEPGTADEGGDGSEGGVRRDGESSGEEKERRYRAMKKSSLSAQKVKRTVYGVNQ
jgi:hypothetical protein